MPNFLSTGLAKATGTNTMRLSMSPVFAGSMFAVGRNWQNIEKSMREMVEAPEGCSIIQTDQSGADARIVAWEAPPGNFRDLFIHGIKPHSFVALRRFVNEFASEVPTMANEFHQAATTPIKELKSLPYWKQLSNIIADSDGWISRKRYYFIGKTQCHSLNYDCGAKQYKDTLTKRSEGTLIISKEESQFDVDNYKVNLFPEIFNDWHPRVLSEYYKTKILRNLFGHPRKFTRYIEESEKKELYAFIPQSTVGVISHKAAIKFQRFRQEKKLQWFLFNNCHDSLAALAPDDEAVECAKVLKGFMETDLVSSRGESFKMYASVGVGKNWAPYHEKKNPFGIKEI